MIKQIPASARVLRGGIRRLQSMPVLGNIERAIVSGYLKPMLEDGHVSIVEAQALSQVVRGLKTDGPMIEIGTLFGFSTMMLAVAKSPERELITVDSFQWNPLNLAADNQKAVTSSFLKDAVLNANVRMVCSDKDEFFLKYDGPTPSLMFLDADHEYGPTLHDIREAKRLGAEVICGHDYGPEWPGVVQAVEESGGLALLAESCWVLKQQPALS